MTSDDRNRPCGPELPTAGDAGWLPSAAFAVVARAAPLIAIDLIVRDENGHVLLGRRKSRPARDCWFVQGGRVRKNERLADALARIAAAELGLAVSIGEVDFLGVYEHFYSDNPLGEDDWGTHYVVLAYALCVRRPITPPLTQHGAFRWFDEGLLRACVDVHPYTKAYCPAGAAVSPANALGAAAAPARRPRG
jgi:colanic acid biosynthesis protein WcaH